MAADESRDRPNAVGDGVPAASEQLHLPGPTYLPVIVALGVTLAVVGVVISFVITAIGLLIMAVAIARWVRETRADIAELPLEH